MMHKEKEKKPMQLARYGPYNEGFWSETGPLPSWMRVWPRQPLRVDRQWFWNRSMRWALMGVVGREYFGMNTAETPPMDAVDATGDRRVVGVYEQLKATQHRLRGQARFVVSLPDDRISGLMALFMACVALAADVPTDPVDVPQPVVRLGPAGRVAFMCLAEALDIYDPKKVTATLTLRTVRMMGNFFEKQVVPKDRSTSKRPLGEPHLGPTIVPEEPVAEQPALFRSPPPVTPTPFRRETESDLRRPTPPVTRPFAQGPTVTKLASPVGRVPTSPTDRFSQMLETSNRQTPPSRRSEHWHMFCFTSEFRLLFPDRDRKSVV